SSALAMPLMFALARSTLALSPCPITLGTINAASRPRMVTTTMISSSVKPCWRRTARILLITFSLSIEHGVHVQHRQHHGEHHQQDNARHKQQHQGAKQPDHC